MNNHSEQLNDLAKALVAAQGEFPTVAKDSNNPFFKSKYAALPEVMKAAGPVLTKHGLAVSQFVTHEGSESQLQTYLLHESGQFITHAMPLLLTKQDAQGQGSAITYARRYSYMAVLGLVADEDDDGNAASRLQTKPPLVIMPAPAHMSEKPVVTDNPAATITADQAKELMQIAKMKGHTDRANAVAFLNEATGLSDFTDMPADEFDLYKKRVTTAGWGKADN
ncbi:ERF family protein [Arthrobacter sp. NicSoilC5]|uniref:ERF family protein n=1 Tax=Arthrobacter sp. NicSoilC5 TaxID=2831000 RepID=UPI001CC7D1E5|nr:ERF family protein [Arthrobacter sp. NicSoilC5]BCW78305.1 hypothetical protein NicSoilC5_03240 [Arthrobacter sp. NicSoilC5]